MIDLHCHILPGLDDGAPDTDASVEMALWAVDDGIETVAATPHVREDYPYELGEIEARTRALNAKLAEEGIDLDVVTGAEVAPSRLPQLDDSVLAGLCLGRGPYVLLESPYFDANEALEAHLFRLQVRGFRPVLAHPERSPSFRGNPERLAAIVREGVACSITAASMAGRFGSDIQRETRGLFEYGLVHNVASDAHDVAMRSPEIRAGFQVLDVQLPGLVDQMPWYTEEVPAAILAGEALPQGPPPAPRRRRFWHVPRRASRW